MGTLFEVNDVSLSYNHRKQGKYVVRDVDFCVDEGELLAIAGPSGSGKTSFLSAMFGGFKPCCGTVRYRGQDIYGFDERQMDSYRNEDIGVVFQFFNLIADMTAVENVILPSLIRGDSRRQAEERAKELLGEFGLREKAAECVKTLSGGQQQRVALARALMNAPAAILADEPTANLDSKTARYVIGIFSQLCKECGCALVVATHDERIVEAADSLLELK